MTKKKPLEVTIRWSHLERIARYYQFPSAVFLAPTKVFSSTTREQALRNQLNKIKDIVNDS